MAQIDFSDDIVNISDITDSIEELREEREACQIYDEDDCETLDDEALDAAFKESDSDSAEELVNNI